MKLSDLLKALAYNTTLNITLVDSEEVELITFNAVGYKAVESELGKKKVKKVKVTSATTLTIVLDEEEVSEESTNTDQENQTTDPETTNTDPTDPEPTGGD